jgi:hypothetical protein
MDAMADLRMRGHAAGTILVGLDWPLRGDRPFVP